jgi:outer membrane protein assembly factor BamB
VGLDLAAPGEPKILWEKRAKTAVPYVPCPLARDGHIYWITDQGIAECVNAKTGEVIWTERVFNRGVSSSPIMIGDTVLAIDESGKAMAWKATPEGYEPVATSDVGEPVFASPAVANGRLYIRGVSKLLCIGTKE